MRLTAAFFANRAAVVDDMLNVEGGFWASTTVAEGADGFVCCLVIVCEVDGADVGHRFALHIDATGPSGRRWTPARSCDFTVASPMKFLCIPSMVLPIEAGGGHHLYTLRLDGQHERVDLPLDIRQATA